MFTVQIQDLSIGYPGKHGPRVVAQGLTANIRRGELTCLLGANGVGKSTLLRTLSAFQPKLSGRIVVQGRDLEAYSIGQQSRLISVVLTERCAVRNMTVRELVGLGRSPYTGFWGRLTADDEAVVDDSLRQVGIQPLASRMTHTLSDGERQKVMIAKALAQQAPIIYLDEPTAFLDYPSKVEVMQLLHRISLEADKTVFLSTHDVELALQLADVVWLMDRVRGLTVGTPEDLSLNGSLGTFFSGRGVTFNRTTGLFAVDCRVDAHVCLQGAGDSYAMARKALQRIGVGVDGSGRADIRIQAEDVPNGARYTLTFAGGETVVAGSIAELLQVVGQHASSASGVQQTAGD